MHAGCASSHHSDINQSSTTPKHEVYDRSVGKWKNPFKNNVELAGVIIDQFPEIGWESGAYEGKHPAVIFFIFWDGRVHQSTYQPDGTLVDDYWWKEKLLKDSKLWKDMDYSHGSDPDFEHHSDPRK